MAQCKLSPQEFVKNSFMPQVAVICSSKAEETCRKNNLSFTELLQPFCKLGTEGIFEVYSCNKSYTYNQNSSSLQRSKRCSDILEEFQNILTRY